MALLHADHTQAISAVNMTDKRHSSRHTHTAGSSKRGQVWQHNAVHSNAFVALKSRAVGPACEDDTIGVCAVDEGRDSCIVPVVGGVGVGLCQVCHRQLVIKSGHIGIEGVQPVFVLIVSVRNYVHVRAALKWVTVSGQLVEQQVVHSAFWYLLSGHAVRQGVQAAYTQ